MTRMTCQAALLGVLCFLLAASTATVATVPRPWGPHGLPQPLAGMGELRALGCEAPLFASTSPSSALSLELSPAPVALSPATYMPWSPQPNPGGVSFVSGAAPWAPGDSCGRTWWAASNRQVTPYLRHSAVAANVLQQRYPAGSPFDPPAAPTPRPGMRSVAPHMLADCIDTGLYGWTLAGRQSVIDDMVWPR